MLSFLKQIITISIRCNSIRINAVLAQRPFSNASPNTTYSQNHSASHFIYTNVPNVSCPPLEAGRKSYISNCVTEHFSSVLIVSLSIFQLSSPFPRFYLLNPSLTSSSNYSLLAKQNCQHFIHHDSFSLLSIRSYHLG